MKFNISVEPENGHYVAQVVGNPTLRAEGINSETATLALREALRQKMRQGRLFSIELEPEIEIVAESTTGPKPMFYNFHPKTIRDVAGIFKDDPDIMEICTDIYRARDEEKRREFGDDSIG